MANPKTDSTGQIVKTAPDNSLAGFLTLMKPQIAQAMPKHLTPDRMARVVMTALRTVPGLGSCTRESFAGCVMTMAQLGLEPNTPLGHGWLIPRNMKGGGKECTLIIGYQGMLELSRRAGVLAMSYTVRADDEFHYELGLFPTLRHVPSSADNRGDTPLSHVYAVARTREFPDQPIFTVLTRSDVLKRKARSAAAGKSFSPWQSDEEAMWQKTGIRALWKWMPKTIEAATVEAMEHAADTGSSQLNAQIQAMDPAVADALQRAHGLDLTLEADTPADGELDVNPETGEVTQ